MWRGCPEVAGGPRKREMRMILICFPGEVRQVALEAESAPPSGYLSRWPSTLLVICTSRVTKFRVFVFSDLRERNSESSKNLLPPHKQGDSIDRHNNQCRDYPHND